MIKKIFPILAFSIFSSLLGSGIIVPLLPLYAENLGASGIWLGIIFSGFSIAHALTTPFAGRLSDRVGRKVLLAAGLFAYSVISLGFTWADSVLQLSLVRFLQGISAGFIIPIAQAYIGDISPRAEEGKWMGYFNATFFTGFGVGPLAGGVLTEQFGMNAAFYTMGGLNMLAFLIVILFLPETHHKRMPVNQRSSYAEIGRSNMVKALFSFRLALAIGRGSFATFLPIFAAMFIGLSPSLIGVLLATNILIMSVLQPLGGNIADKVSRRGLVILGSLFNLAYLALIPSTGSFLPLLMVCALGGIGGAIAMPAASALVVEEGRKYGMGSTIAVFSMAFGIGMATGPLLAGAIADNINVESVFYFGAIVGLMGIIAFTWFTRHYRNSDLDSRQQKNLR